MESISINLTKSPGKKQLAYLAEHGGDPVVQEDAWSQGFCRSDTCGCLSHDPYTEYPVLHLRAKHLGTFVTSHLEEGQMYRLPNGELFAIERWQNGDHKNDTIQLLTKLSGVEVCQLVPMREEEVAEMVEDLIQNLQKALREYEKWELDQSYAE